MQQEANRYQGAWHARTRACLPIINTLWIGQLSPLECLCLRSFVAAGHPVHLYSYGQLENVPQGVTLQDAGDILPRSLVFQNQLGKGQGSLAAFSDLFRYKLLLDRGGWWVDADVFCLRPFDFNTPYVFGSERGAVASAVLKMPRGCPLAERCYESACRVEPSSIVWNELVEILRRGVRELKLESYILPEDTFAPIDWREVTTYVEGRRDFVPTARSRAVHLFHEMWRRNNLDKWRRYPSSSVLNVLRATLPQSAPFQRHAPLRQAA